MCCIGAANALANPRRALRVLPGALYELGRHPRRRRQRRAAAGREHPAGADRPPAAGRRRSAACGPSAGSSCRCSRTPSTGRCCWPPRWTRAGTAARARTRRRPGGSTAALLVAGLLGPVRRRLRPARRDRAAPARAAARSPLGAALCVAGLGAGQPAGDAHDVPARPWRWPEWVVAGCGVRHRRRVLRDQQLRPAEPHPGDQPAGLADAAARPRPWPSCSRRCRRSSRHRRSGRPGRPARSRAPVREAGTRVITFDRGHRHLRRRRRGRCCAT